MKKILKSAFVFMLAFVSIITIAACGSKKTSTTKRNTTKNNNTTTDKITTKGGDTPTGDNFTVTLEGEKEGVTVNTSYVDIVDGTPTPVIVEYGKAYPKDKVLYVQVINNTTDQIRISAFIGNSKLDSYLVEGLDIDDNPGYGGLFDLPLKGDIKIKVEVANDAIADNLNLTVDESGDTTTEINTIHVYKPDTLDKNDLENGAQIEVGQELKVIVWNVATDVHVTIYNDEDTIVDKVFAKLTDEQIGPDGRGHGDEGIFEFTVKGTVTVDMEVYKESTDGVAIYYSNQTSDTIAVTITANDETISSGDIVDKNSNVTVAGNNTNDKKYIICALVDGDKIVDSLVINANDDFTFAVPAEKETSFIIEDYEEYTVTYDEVEGFSIGIYDYDTLVTSGSKVAKYTSLFPTAMNNSDKDYVIVVYYGEEFVFSKVIKSNDHYAFEEDLYIQADLYVKVVEDKVFTVTFNNSYEDIQIYASVPDDTTEEGIRNLESGDSVHIYDALMIMAANFNNIDGYVITITIGTEDIINHVDIEYPGFMMDDPIIVKGNIVITIEQK